MSSLLQLSSQPTHGQTLHNMPPLIYPVTLFSLALLLVPAAADPIITKGPSLDLPRLLARQDISGSTSCDPFYSIASSCSAATPDISSLPFSEAATCYCYSSSIFNPAPYDNGFNTCLKYLSTADPAFYSSLAVNGIVTDPCKMFGNVATATSGAKSAMTSTTDLNSEACSAWFDIRSSCALATPSFTALPFSAEASCLCYTSSTFAPSIYDGYWESCVSHYKTASPSFWSASLSSGFVASPCILAEGMAYITMNTTGVGASAPSTSSEAQIPSVSSTPTETGLTTTVATTATPNSGAVSVVSYNSFLGAVLGLVILSQVF